MFRIALVLSESISLWVMARDWNVHLHARRAEEHNDENGYFQPGVVTVTHALFFSSSEWRLGWLPAYHQGLDYPCGKNELI